MVSIASELKQRSLIRIIQLPFRGLVEEFMVSRTREIYQYRNSRNPKVSGAGIEVKTGRRWSATKELPIAEGNMRIKEIVGSVAQGRAGLGADSLLQIRKEHREGAPIPDTGRSKSGDGGKVDDKNGEL